MTEREKHLTYLLKRARDKMRYMLDHGEWYAPESLINEIDKAMQNEPTDDFQEKLFYMKDHVEQLDISLKLLENLIKRSRERIKAVLGKE